MPTSTEPTTDSQRTDASYLLHRVRVARRERLSDGFVRLTFRGPTLDRFADTGLDQRIKLILPAANGSLDAMPFHDAWYGAWRDLADDARPVIRTYTTRAARPEAREVDIDFVLHEPSGPAGRFAASAQEGDEAVLCGPNTGAAQYGGGIDFHLPASARCVLLAGDETALPAIVRIVEALPPGVRGTVLVEVPHEGDGDQVPRRDGVDVRVLVRGGATTGTLLEPAVREAAAELLTVSRGVEPEDVDVDVDLLWEVPGGGEIEQVDGPFYAWLAGEASAIKLLRRALVADLGVDRRAVAFMGYWRTGKAEAA